MSDAKQLSRIFPHVDRGRFNNYLNEAAEDSFGRSLMMYVQSLLVRRNDDPKIIREWFQKAKLVPVSLNPHITWFGHSTYLIQVQGKNILTDPVFGNLTFLFQRILPFPLEVQSLPTIDYVIISHNHRDHMDQHSLVLLKKMFPHVRILVPQGDKEWFDRRGFTYTREYMWWDQMEADGLRLTFLPAFHWSQRGLFDRNKSLWGSWMIEGGPFKIYFAGDTAYADHFTRISHYFSHIDAALMPIGPCEPRSWMKRSHIDSVEAGQAFLDLKASEFFAMHWGTFYFGTDSFLGPVDRLRIWWARQHKQVADKKLHVLKMGQTVTLEVAVSQQKLSSVSERIHELDAL